MERTWSARERVPLDRVEEGTMSHVEVGRGEVEDDRHKGLDIEDGRRQGMESGGGCCDLLVGELRDAWSPGVQPLGELPLGTPPGWTQPHGAAA